MNEATPPQEPPIFRVVGEVSLLHPVYVKARHALLHLCPPNSTEALACSRWPRKARTTSCRPHRVLSTPPTGDPKRPTKSIRTQPVPSYSCKPGHLVGPPPRMSSKRSPRPPAASYTWSTDRSTSPTASMTYKRRSMLSGISPRSEARSRLEPTPSFPRTNWNPSTPARTSRPS